MVDKVEIIGKSLFFVVMMMMMMGAGLVIFDLARIPNIFLTLFSFGLNSASN